MRVCGGMCEGEGMKWYVVVCAVVLWCVQWCCGMCEGMWWDV